MRLGVALVALAACGNDPSLKVVVDLAEGYGVAETTISVYESPLFTCEKVEFGDLSAEELAAALVAEDRVTAPAGTSDGLSGISRTDHKVIVARGYDANGAFVVAGCAEKDEIVDTDKVTVPTMATASISVFNAGDETDPTSLAVTVTDAHVDSIDKRPVAWRVYGPAGSTPYLAANITAGENEWEPTVPTCTNGNGIARLHPMPPSLIGGFATEVRAAWATEPNRLFTGFTSVDVFSNPPEIKPAAQAQRRWCTTRVASNGDRRIVCLDDNGGSPVARDFAVVVTGGVAQLVSMGTQALPAVEATVAVYSVDRVAGGAKVRDAYAITANARVIGLFDPSVDANAGVTVGASVDDAIVMPACDADPARLLVSAKNQLQLLPLEGGTLTRYFASPPATSVQPITLLHAGCMEELVPGGTSRVRQVAVFDVGRAAATDKQRTTAAFNCQSATGNCTLALPVPRADVGFLPDTNRMVGAFFDASGTVLSEWVLQPGDEYKLIERERITAASFPAHLVVGNFDKDGEPDMIWNIANANATVANFQISYARKVRDQRLTALSGPLDDVAVADAIAFDFTGDGLDDLVFTVVQQQTSPPAVVKRVIAIPLGITPPAFTPKPETACNNPKP